jgi:putative transposase
MFYDCYSRYQEGGIEALVDGKPRPRRIWNKIPDKIRSMKNRILLDNYYLPGQLEHSIEEFVSYYNNCRYHESLDKT